MPLDAGTRLGPYEILGPLGAGGMGEVYRARDTRLDRTVAVKVIPSHVAATSELRTRFEREARAVSSLNHPHICVLHDVGHQDGVDFLVMEHMEGETLASRLERGALPTADLLRCGIEIADALDKAHRSGIVHRDLKPGNVMLTKGGAKLMDFGLARGAPVGAPAGAPAEGGSGSGSGLAATPRNLSESPTLARPLTAEGTIVGTFQYMAPEQLEGKEADARTDLFALGAVLYEMATGKKAFEGKSQASLISAIMSSEPPPISALAPMSPPALDRVVRACLAKDPDERIQTAHDVKLELQWIRDAGSQAGVPAPVAARRRGRERLAWSVAVAAVAVALAALVVPRLTQRATEARVMRFSVTAPANLTLTADPTASAISPDGRTLIFLAADSSGTSRIWIRPLESLAAQPVQGTENAYLLFWSPDSRSIGFFADGKLKKVPVGGGSPEVLCDALDARGASWSKDGVIVFAPVAAGPLFRVSADGGDPVEVVGPDSTRHETGLRWPWFLPDGKHFLFVSLPSRQGSFDVYLGSLDSKERKRLLASGAAPIYAEPGYLVFVRNARLMAQRFDRRRLEPTGKPVPLGEAPTVSRYDGAQAVSASANGVLAHPAAGLPNTQLVWLDRSGRRQGAVALPPGRYEGLSLSPDGERVVVEKRSSATAVDLWMVELSRGVATRFTFRPSSGVAVWSPDGSRIAFNSNQAGPWDIYQKLASGAGAEEPLFQSSALFKNLSQWSPDGRYLVFTQPDAATGWDLWLLPVEGDRKPVPYLRSPFNEQSGYLSPDGRWMAYSSDESGKLEVYVQSFPTPGSKYQVSTSGGFAGTWSKDGKEMIIAGTDGTILSVDVQTTPSFKAGTPRVLFKPRQDLVGITGTRDFQRFLVSVPVGEASPSSITLQLNWPAALKR
jgi:Tol biopolymer transport system component